MFLFAEALHPALVARTEVVAVSTATGVHEGAARMRLALVVVADDSGMAWSRTRPESADSCGDHSCALAHAFVTASEVVVVTLTTTVDEEAAQSSSKVVVIPV